jgi:hypothetical protein
VVFVLVAAANKRAALLLLVPFAVLHWASRGYAAERLEQLRLRVTSAATTALAQELDTDRATADFLAVVGDGLHRDAVDLVLVAPTAAVHRWRSDTGARALPATLSRTGRPSPDGARGFGRRRARTPAGRHEILAAAHRPAPDCALPALGVSGGGTGARLYDARKAVDAAEPSAFIAELAGDRLRGARAR